MAMGQSQQERILCLHSSFSTADAYDSVQPAAEGGSPNVSLSRSAVRPHVTPSLASTVATSVCHAAKVASQCASVRSPFPMFVCLQRVLCCLASQQCLRHLGG